MITIKSDPQLYQAAQGVAARLGFPIGTLFNAFLSQMVRQQTVFFSLHDVHYLTPEAETSVDAEIRDAHARYRSGKTKGYTKGRALVKDLL